MIGHSFKKRGGSVHVQAVQKPTSIKPQESHIAVSMASSQALPQ